MCRWESLKRSIWSESVIEQMEGGHVSSILFRRQQFREAIVKCVLQLESK